MDASHKAQANAASALGPKANHETAAREEDARQQRQPSHIAGGEEDEGELGGVPGLPVELQQYLVTLLVGHPGALFAASLTCRLWNLLTLGAPSPSHFSSIRASLAGVDKCMRRMCAGWSGAVGGLTEDVVWRKYALDKWDMLPPPRQQALDDGGQEEQMANTSHNATDWLLLALRRWRPIESVQPQEQHGMFTTSSSTKWRELVRAAHRDLVGVPLATYQGACSLCSSRGERDAVKSVPDSQRAGWWPPAASVYSRHGLKRPLEQWLDALPVMSPTESNAVFSFTRNSKGYHVRDLVLEAIDHRAPPGVLPLLLAHEPTLAPWVCGSSENKIGLVRTTTTTLYIARPPARHTCIS
jgi:hypothetical protein